MAGDVELRKCPVPRHAANHVINVRRLLRHFALVAAFSLSAAAALSAGDLERHEVVRAQLVPRRLAVLSAEIGARIQKIHFVEGSNFAEGDLLIGFDDSLPRAQLERARAVLDAAEMTVAANQRLLQLNSIGQVELDLSKAEVAKARAELQYATAMLARCRIVAPFSGRISEQKAHEQEFVQPAQPLCEIIDDAVPQLDFIAPSKWLAWLHVGQSFQVKIEETGLTYPAVVERIGAKVDAVSQTVKVTAAVTAKPSDLMAGMSGVIQLSPQVP